MKLLRQTARMNWWSGLVSALLIILFFQDAIGREAYAYMILSGALWMSTPAWVWVLALILLNAFVFWFTNQVFPVRHPVKELKSDHTDLFDKLKGDDDDTPPGPELPV
jgi:cell division protein FtsW (lipid II flippase)